MHRVAVKSNLVDSGSELTKLRYGGDEAPVCPKPRRLGSALPDFLKLHNCTKHSQLSTNGRSEFLNMITGKSEDTSRESSPGGNCTGCSPLCYSGSPPRRSDNPLVHDVEFIHQMELLSPFTTRTSKLFDSRFGFTSSASPTN
ncbi:hypothetical protein BVC80_1383g16 [Macleaya cordata]|uniref:Uncharacterized protein n=1 Tax=Macleaya cordata TaxID=56857 RepID=A0A200Q5U3_MACCD|nr:hypothetical protein BVC80_1383g16 [Macleaya cordata]